MAFEWVANRIDKEKFNLNFILLNPGDSDLENYLVLNKIPFERIKYEGKKDFFIAFLSVYKYLKRNKTDVVHTHLFDANLIGFIAAFLAGTPKRIYTRHHSDYHHQYFLQAVKYDKIVNFLATSIISISENVTQILLEKEKVPKKKIQLIYHGFLLEEFNIKDEERINRVITLYNPYKKKPVIGVIARYTEWKGVQFIIPAFKKILKEYPDAVLIIANANGDYSNKIKKLLNELPKESYLEISFENDIAALYKTFDVFVHTPINQSCEAFGQTYVEALAAGVSSVFTLSGIANEFIEDHRNALVVSHQDSDAIYNAMRELLENTALVEKLILNGKKDVSAKFGLDQMVLSLEKLYGR